MARLRPHSWDDKPTAPLFVTCVRAALPKIGSPIGIQATFALTEVLAASSGPRRSVVTADAIHERADEIDVGVSSLNPNATPEPGSLLLLATGATVLLRRRRRHMTQT